MSIIDINHAYSQFYGLYSDVDFDEIRAPELEEPVIADDGPFPALSYLEKPLCVECSTPNLSLRDERCLICRISLR